MQTLEAMLSLTFLLLSSSYLMLSVEPHHMDDSLYRLHMAEDAWRVLHLRGDLQDLSDGKRDEVEATMEAMGRESGLCYFLGGQRFTNCRAQGMGPGIITIKRLIIMEGAPQEAAFSIMVPSSIDE